MRSPYTLLPWRSIPLIIFLLLEAVITRVQAVAIQVTSPNGGQIMSGQTVQVAWTVGDTTGGGMTKILLVGPNGFSRQVSITLDPALLAVGVGSHQWSWTPEGSIPNGDGYQIEVQGSSATGTSASFTFGVVRSSTPAVTSTSVRPTTSSVSSSSTPTSNMATTSSVNLSRLTSITGLTSSTGSTTSIITLASSTSSTNTSSISPTSTDSSSADDISSFVKIGAVLGAILGLVVVSGLALSVVGKINRSRRLRQESDAVPLTSSQLSVKEPQVLSDTPKFDIAPVYLPPQAYYQPRPPPPPQGGNGPYGNPTQSSPSRPPNYPHFGGAQPGMGYPRPPPRPPMQAPRGPPQGGFR